MAKLGYKGNGHTTETPDVSHVRNPDVTHELSDVNVPGILKFVVALVVMTVVVYVLMWLLFGFYNSQEAKKEAPPGPMAMTEQESLPPEPRLQAARGFGVKLENGEWVNLEKREPQEEYRVLKEQWDRVLKEGPKDQSGNPAGLPIEQAMQRVVEGQGLPSRPQQGPPQEMTDYTIGTPTAASSGRVTEKGKQ
ncbi:MAG TPA: hypothetical protein VES69_01320 [Pyrinomonadaceae bacterium]|nr:hypothetical protein [Pyrinomonadaceae bacterium]